MHKDEKNLDMKIGEDEFLLFKTTRNLYGIY